MKKKRVIFLIIFLLLAILLIPLPSGVYKDGGTREFRALTYKIVSWNKIASDKTCTDTDLYLFPDNLKSIDTLWTEKEKNMPETFLGTIVEYDGSYVLVRPLKNQPICKSSDLVSFSVLDFEPVNLPIGCVVEVSYTGQVRESYPAQIDAVSWKKPASLRNRAYEGEWLDKEEAVKVDHDPASDIIIDQIFSDCFIATPVIPMPTVIKVNCTLSDEWCEGDQVICTFENVYHEEGSPIYEADLVTIAESDFRLDPNACYKPVIYLYPEKETEVSVALSLNGELTCTYPLYDNGWTVLAEPDGTLTDKRGQKYNYLYWEGETEADYDFSKGFCVKGEDTAEFLEKSLAALGLNRREANEFIVYWLPLMESNPYNIISFQGDAYTEAAKLTITPEPDTLIRVFMTWKKSESFVEIPAQTLAAPERQGFTAIEWGGTEIR